MAEWFSNLVDDPLVFTILIYLLGVITGWFLWSGKKAAAVDSVNGDVTFDEEDDVTKPLPIDEPLEDKDAVKNAAKALFSKPSSSDDQSEQGNSDPAPNSMKLGALESELRNAREMLSQVIEEKAVHAEHLNDMDNALKRANGRLKLILKAVKKARPD